MTLDRMDFTPPGNAEQWREGAIRVTSEEARLYLKGAVTPELLRQWHARGNIKRIGRDRFDLGSILNYLMERQQRGKLTA